MLILFSNFASIAMLAQESTNSTQMTQKGSQIGSISIADDQKMVKSKEKENTKFILIENFKLIIIKMTKNLNLLLFKNSILVKNLQ